MEKIELESAINLILNNYNYKPTNKLVNILDSLGLILAEDIIAPINQPPFSRSPLDGIALRSCDTLSASPTNPISLTKVHTIYCGMTYSGQINQNEAVRIMTGAAIPADADCVIKQEDITFTDTGFIITTPMKPYQNYCHEGEDFKVGQLLIEKGEKITAVHIGIIASLGLDKVLVQHIKIGLLSTGDELLSVGEPLVAGKIYNSNTPLLSSRMKELGIEVIPMAISDDPELIANELKNIFEQVDHVVTTGGVSVGEKDVMHDVITLLGAQKLFWKVNIKPGTPILCAKYQDKLLFSLSGNPFAAFVTFELIVKPILCNVKLNTLTAILTSDYGKSSPTRRIIRGYYKDGYVSVNSHNESGVLSSLKNCNCLVDVAKNSPPLKAGISVRIHLL